MSSDPRDPQPDDYGPPASEQPADDPGGTPEVQSEFWPGAEYLDAPDTTTEGGYPTEPSDAHEPAVPELSAAPQTPELPWPNETGSTAERAIVTDATSGLMMHRLTVWRDEIFAWVRTLISAAVYAILIVTFGFQVARVEGDSMNPTLTNQDRLIVNKLVYRLGPPRRDDIVMLYYPPDPDKSFVKRVIAEEGELVKIENGRVFVNDVPLNDDYIPEIYRSHDELQPTLVKEGYYFVMGDHRNNSSDSRIWGEVPKKYIIGKVQLRWWPIQSARIF